MSKDSRIRIATGISHTCPLKDLKSNVWEEVYYWKVPVKKDKADIDECVGLRVYLVRKKNAE